MSKTPNDGGPAFPNQPTVSNYGCPGMSLRAWLAGKALSGVCITESNLPDHVIARQVVSVADAVLRQLQQPDPEQMDAMRYTTAMHMLRVLSDGQPYRVLALCPNVSFEPKQEVWDVLDVVLDPYNPNDPNPSAIIARDPDPLNAVATAAKILSEEQAKNDQ